MTYLTQRFIAVTIHKLPHLKFITLVFVPSIKIGVRIELTKS